MIKFFYKNKKIIVAIIIIIAIFLSGSNNVLAATTGEAAIGLGNYFLGGIGYAISLVLSLIAYILTAVIGLLITVVVAVLIQVAQYGNIINVPTVIEGWVIIRDLCNMLFILILLIVAFATILRIESYQWKKILPKLLIMAVLINFSRTIFGLLIDFSQVIMLTFVNAFSAGGGYFIDAFRANRFFSVKGATSGDFAVDTWSTAISIIAGVLAAIITLIVVSVMLAVLVMRIVMLWIYTIFSPLIFLGFAVPAIQKYTGKIWEDFTKQLVVGPVLAFFIWLALTTASKSTDLLMEQNLTSTEVCVGAGAFFCQGNFQQFIIVIGLLMGGLMVAQEMGGAAGSIAGKGLDWAKKSALAPIAGAGKGVKALAAFGADKIQHSGIMDLNIVRAWTKLQESRKDKKSRMYAEGQDAAAARMARSGGVFSGLLAATATPGGAWEDISTGFSLRHPFSSKGIKQRRMGGKGMAAKREELLPGLQQAEFEASFSKLDKVEQEKELEKNSFESLRLTNAIKSEKDEEKKKKLIKEKEIADKKTTFASDEYLSNRSEGDQKEWVDKKDAVAEAKRKDFEQYIPTYSFEAKSAEEKAIGAEADKIKKIDDQQELVRMLKEAIGGHEKSRIKAIMRKLTADYNDNEAFAALVPEAGTGYQGLQALMDGLSTKGDKNYAGFDKQEAYSLGAQVAEMNKKTNHWEAAAAYKMDNGQWRGTTAEEHAMIASTEFGKRAPRANARDFNRLAMGKHILDPKTGKMKYEMADIGLIALQSWDNSTSIDRILEDMTESLAKYLVPFLDKLEQQDFFKARGTKKISELDGRKDKYGKLDETPTLADMIRIKANKAAEDFGPQFREVTGVREKLNS